MKIVVALHVAALALPLSAQTWSPYGALGTPFGTVTASSRGLLSVAHFSPGGGQPATLMVREHDGNNWVQSNAPTPPPRIGFAMAYDSGRQRVVFFGGRVPLTTTRLSDTWEWTGGSWLPQLTLTYPSARSGARMSFDSVRGRVVLFGGVDGQGFVNDTWEYASGQWMQIPVVGAKPAGRGHHALAFDPIRKEAVLLGGENSDGYLGDTWVWNGVDWAERIPNGQGRRRAEHGMCFDSHSGGVLVFGGRWSDFSSVFLDAPEVWNGVSWVAKSYYQMPSARAGHAMALDEVHQRIMILGGASPIDAWVFPGTIQAGQQSYGNGCGNLSLVTTDRPILGQSGRATLSRPQSFGLSYVSVGLSDSALGPLALPLPLDGYGLPGCWLRQDAALTAHGHCTPTGANSASFSVAIPNVPVLSGLRLYLQGWVPDFTANQGGLVTSNGLRWVLGNW